jgi:hypothetical protein
VTFPGAPRNELPDGRRYVRLSELARALGLPLRTVRTFADTHAIRTMPRLRNATRWVPIEELDRLEAEGWPIDWTEL